MRIADQGWWCRSLQWFCDGGGQHVNGASAPEIDAALVALAMALVLGGVAIFADRSRRR